MNEPYSIETLTYLCIHSKRYIDFENHLQTCIEKCINLDKWPNFAQQQGMSSIIYDCVFNFSQKRTFDTHLLKRFKASSFRQYLLYQAQEKALEYICEILNQYQIPCILLKGSALRNTVYQKPHYRSMTDLDILVPLHVVQQTRKILLQHACSAPPYHASQERKHHTAPVFLNMNGFQICIEIHRYMPCNRYAESFDEIITTAQPSPYGTSIYIPSYENLYIHTYEHAFRSSLRWMKWRMIWLLDLIAIFEYLPNKKKFKNLHTLISNPNIATAQYHVWPHAKFKTSPFKDILFPNSLWLQIRYSNNTTHLEQHIKHWLDLLQEITHPWQGP